MKKITRLTSIIALCFVIVSCGTTKTATKTAEPILPPDGINYQTVKNYKDYASIQLPVEGKGFKNKANTGESRPHIYQNNIELRCLTPDFSKTDGDLNAQLDFLIKKYGIKPENVVATETLKLADKNVVKFDLIKFKHNNGNIRVLYGYLVQHGQRASLFMLDTGVSKEDKLSGLKSTFDEGLVYTIKTLIYN